MHIGMFNSCITGHWFSAAAKAIWDDQGQLQAWLDVEAALALAQAELGVIPPEAARTIAAQAQVQRLDLVRLAEDIAFAQHPLVPVLRQLEALCGEPAAGYVHWGATTQNIFDTATALQMLRSHALITQALSQAQDTLAEGARRHAGTVMAGRTHGQHALPMTWGFKLATWLQELDRNRQRLEQRLAASFPACVGGAIGTHAAMGAAGPQVEAALAHRLGLLPAGLASRAAYDRPCDYFSALGLLAGTAQKIGQDLVFLQRTEIAEVAEAFHWGKVGSSTMAQKRNPATGQLLISLARLLRGRLPMALEAMARADEGDSSSTNLTDVLVPEIALLGVAVAETLARLLDGLVVDAVAMQRNLDLTGGLIATEAVMMRLGQSLGRHEAHQVLYDVAQRAQSQGRSFRDCLLDEPRLAGVVSAQTLAQWLDPAGYTGLSAELAHQAAGASTA